MWLNLEAWFPWIKGDRYRGLKTNQLVLQRVKVWTETNMEVNLNGQKEKLGLSRTRKDGTASSFIWLSGNHLNLHSDFELLVTGNGKQYISTLKPPGLQQHVMACMLVGTVTWHSLCCSQFWFICSFAGTVPHQRKIPSSSRSCAHRWILSPARLDFPPVSVGLAALLGQLTPFLALIVGSYSPVFPGPPNTNFHMIHCVQKPSPAFPTPMLAFLSTSRYLSLAQSNTP